MDTVNIKLDGSLKSDLSWDAQKKLAEKSKNILWDIDLGLFSRLHLPLSTETQSKSLRLSLDVFHRDIWEKYQDRSLVFASTVAAPISPKISPTSNSCKIGLRTLFHAISGSLPWRRGLRLKGFEEYR